MVDGRREPQGNGNDLFLWVRLNQRKLKANAGTAYESESADFAMVITTCRGKIVDKSESLAHIRAITTRPYRGFRTLTKYYFYDGVMEHKKRGEPGTVSRIFIDEDKAQEWYSDFLQERAQELLPKELWKPKRGGENG